MSRRCSNETPIISHSAARDGSSHSSQQARRSQGPERRPRLILTEGSRRLPGETSSRQSAEPSSRSRFSDQNQTPAHSSRHVPVRTEQVPEDSKEAISGILTVGILRVFHHAWIFCWRQRKEKEVNTHICHFPCERRRELRGYTGLWQFSRAPMQFN